MRIAFTLGLVLAAAMPAAATTVAELSPASIAERSDLIGRVVVRSQRSAWIGRRIITFYDVDVVEPWQSQGAAPARKALVALPGGAVDGISQLVPGTPVLELGGTYVLCLGKDNGPAESAREGAPRARGIVGLWRGVFRVDDTGLLHPFDHGARAAAPIDVVDLRARLLGTP